jgi:hypothetical protein
MSYHKPVRVNVAATTAINTYAKSQREVVVRVVNDVDAEVESIAASTDEIVIRILKLAPALLEAVSGRHYSGSQGIAGQIMMLARLAEQNMLVCAERKRASLVVAQSILDELPQHDPTRRY